MRKGWWVGSLELAERPDPLKVNTLGQPTGAVRRHLSLAINLTIEQGILDLGLYPVR